MNEERRTIVGGRSRSNRLIRDFPRGIEILLKKASVDSQFCSLLLKNPNIAAESIELNLNSMETEVLKNTNNSVLRKMITNTRVPKQHVKTFRTARTAAVLILLLSSTVILSAGGTKGIEVEVAQEFEQEELAVERMAVVQFALEAFKKDFGRYPETREWFESSGPLSEYAPLNDFYDPWNRRFHYKTVKVKGEIVNYKLESFGLDPDSFYDNIPCPIATDKHRFTGENPLRILYPLDGHTINLDTEKPKAILIFKAEHENENILVDWYLDGLKVGTTAKSHVLSKEQGIGSHTLLLVDENGDSASIVFSVSE